MINKEYKIDQLDKEPEESIYTYGFTNQSQKIVNARIS